MKFWPVIVTYLRPAVVRRNVETVREVLGDRLGGISVSFGDPEPPMEEEPGLWVTRARLSKPYEGAGYQRNVGAKALRGVIPLTDSFIFVDDDCMLLPPLAEHLDAIAKILEAPGTGLVSIPANVSSGNVFERKDTFIHGGGFMKAGVFYLVGGFGLDYLDDNEMSLRLHIAGFKNYFYGKVHSLHGQGGEGGLTALYGRRSPTNVRSAKFSRLPERYPGHIVADNSWLGVHFTK